MRFEKRFHCADCGGENLFFTSFSKFNVETQAFVIDHTAIKYAFCDDCARDVKTIVSELAVNDYPPKGVDMMAKTGNL